MNDNFYWRVIDAVCRIVDEYGADVLLDSRFGILLRDKVSFEEYPPLEDFFAQFAKAGYIAEVMEACNDKKLSEQIIKRIVDSQPRYAPGTRKDYATILYSVAIAVGACSRQDYSNFIGDKPQHREKESHDTANTAPRTPKNGNNSSQRSGRSKSAGRRDSNSTALGWKIIGLMILGFLAVLFSFICLIQFYSEDTGLTAYAIYFLLQLSYMQITSKMLDEKDIPRRFRLSHRSAYLCLRPFCVGLTVCAFLIWILYLPNVRQFLWQFYHSGAPLPECLQRSGAWYDNELLAQAGMHCPGFFSILLFFICSVIMGKSILNMNKKADALFNPACRDIADEKKGRKGALISTFLTLGVFFIMTHFLKIIWK